MQKQEIENRLIEINHELAAISTKSYAIGSAGLIAGAAFGITKKSGALKTVGLALVGGLVAGIPTRLFYADKAAKLLAEKSQLENDLFDIETIK